MRKKMSRAFVYFVLAILLIAVHSTIAFSSNIHEKMTRTERMAIFGSEDTVPEYQVFSMSLPGRRRRRETDEALSLNVQLHDKKVDLTLKPTAGYLATKYTPVWRGYGLRCCPDTVQYYPLPEAMSDIGEFKMYHDVENKAAITVYTDPIEETILEGLIDWRYVIRSLPKRLMKEILTVGYEIGWNTFTKKRSITSEEDTVHFAVFKAPAASNHSKPSAPVDPDNLQREKRASDAGGKPKDPKAAVYPQILLVLDHNAIRTHTITEALRYILAFWNAVDLNYRIFDNPKVHLNIGGIIIGETDYSTPYIASDVSENVLGDTDIMLSKMGKYFYAMRGIFTRHLYDIIIAMTTIKVCGISEYPCHTMYQIADRDTACLSNLDVSKTKTIKGKGIISYDWQFTGIVTAVEALAYIFGATEVSTKKNAECSASIGDLMTIRTRFQSFADSFRWPECTRRFLSEYFSSDKSHCLDNKPLWMKTVGAVLPGRWLSMNGQCQNNFYDKSCTVKKRGKCSTLHCKVKSGPCRDTFKVPLPGSKCGSHMHCSIEKKCVFAGWHENE